MIRYLLVIILLICSVNAHSISWVEQLGLKERSVGPDTTDRLGQLWVEGTSKDLMYKDSDGNDYNILLGGGIGGAQLNDLSDVDTYTASPTAGQFLKYNGSLWVPGDIPIINALDDVGDVNVASATEGQVLTRIGSQWQAKDASGGASGHNSLTGLQGGTTGEYYHLTSAVKTAADTLTGTANYVSKFTGSGLAASRIFDNGTNIGIGTTNPTSKLTINGGVSGTETVTATATGSFSPNLFTVNINPASTSSTEIRALGFSATTQGSSQLATIRGGYYEVRSTGTGAITNSTGIASTGIVFASTAQNIPVVSEVNAYFATPINSFSNTVTGTITTARGYRVSASSLTPNQVLTNLVGVSIDTQSNGLNNTYLLMGQSSPPSGNYAIYSATANQSFLSGSLGLGNSTPSTKLYVTGDSTVTGYQYFGDPVTNGSFRMYVSGGALLIEKRISGTWTSVGKFDEL